MLHWFPVLSTIVTQIWVQIQRHETLDKDEYRERWEQREECQSFQQNLGGFPRFSVKNEYARTKKQKGTVAGDECRL